MDNEKMRWWRLKVALACFVAIVLFGTVLGLVPPIP